MGIESERPGESSARDALEREGWHVGSSPVAIPSEEFPTADDLLALSSPGWEARIVPGDEEGTFILYQRKLPSTEPEWRPEVPPGTYDLVVHYLDVRQGVERTKWVSDLHVSHNKMTLEDLERDARSWISMVGLHNFGLQASDREPQEVRYDIIDKHTGKVFHSASTKVGMGGHIVR
jgi:hypothetical protein